MIRLSRCDGRFAADGFYTPKERRDSAVLRYYFLTKLFNYGRCYFNFVFMHQESPAPALSGPLVQVESGPVHRGFSITRDVQAGTKLNQLVQSHAAGRNCPGVEVA